MEVSTLYSTNLPVEFIDSLPKYCEECGSPTDINPALTEIMCSNSTCSSKIVMRIHKMCNAYGIKDIGVSGIQSWVDSANIVNPLELFNVVDGQILEGLSEKKSDRVVSQILSVKRVTLPEFLAKAQIPDIESSAYQLLEGYSSLEDFYEDMESHDGVNFVRQRLNISQKISNMGEVIVSARATKVYISLVRYKDELLEGIKYFDIYEKDKTLDEYIIIASDEVGGDFATKRAFYEYIEDRYKDFANFTIGKSVTKKTDIVIWKGFDGTPARVTSKVKKTYQLYEQGVEISGYSADEFIEEFDNRYNLAKN